MSDHSFHVVAGILDPASENDPIVQASSRIASAAGGVLHLVYAREGDAGTLPSDGAPALDRMPANALAEVDSRLEIRRHRRPGDAAEAILAVAREVGAGIIVVGPSRRGEFAGAVLGTTAQRVLRASAAPVLVSRAATEPGRRRILLTTDLAADSGPIASAAAGLLPLLGVSPDSEIRILLVGGDEVLLPPPVRRGPLKDHSEEQLDAFLRREPFGGGIRPEPRVRLGLAGREIVEEASEWGADLVMVGTRGRTGGDRLLLGSVAETVVTRATCDVLVIPPATDRAYDEQREERPWPPDTGSG